MRNLRITASPLSWLRVVVTQHFDAGKKASSTILQEEERIFVNDGDHPGSPKEHGGGLRFTPLGKADDERAQKMNKPERG